MKNTRIESLADAHVHLQGAPGDQTGLILLNSACEADWDSILKQSTETCVPFIGMHPWHIATATFGWLERLDDVMRSSSAGLGEVGLDRFRGPSAEEQETALRGQLDIAMELNRPVSLHCVKRWGVLMAVLKRYAPLNKRVMVHGFYGSLDVMNELISMGCMISVGFDLFADKPKVRELWQELPLEFALLESDAPDGMQNSHLYQKGLAYEDAMARLYARAAELKDLEQADLIRRVEGNLRALSG